MEQSQPSHLFNGAVAGFIATAPMSAAMLVMHKFLPPHEQYPLPPREITEKVAEKVGVEEQMIESEETVVTIVSHFAYGAAAGALYATVAGKIPAPPALGGAVFGLGVWAGSYLGGLPALGILRPATEHPARRNALMIAAHLIWGSTTGVLVDQLERQGNFNGREIREGF